MDIKTSDVISLFKCKYCTDRYNACKKCVLKSKDDESCKTVERDTVSDIYEEPRVK